MVLEWDVLQAHDLNQVFRKQKMSFTLISTVGLTGGNIEPTCTVACEAIGYGFLERLAGMFHM